MATDGNLSRFIESHSKESHLRVQEELGDGFVRLRSEEAERRQAAHDIRSSEDIVIEMLRNSRDAGARNIFLATGKEGEKRFIVMIDDGSGVPSYLHKLIFEPRVTSKLDSVHMDKWGVHGRGMALYSIQQNSEIAEVVSSDLGIGSALRVVTNTKELTEKTDQSTFPVLVRNESGTVSMRGPKNILRTACEFALEHRHSVNVFVGSMADIAATLYAYGTSTVPAQVRAFQFQDESIPLVKSLAYASDQNDFVDLASQMGLTMSTRTAYRILEGKIQPLDSLLELMSSLGLYEAVGVKSKRSNRADARGKSRKGPAIPKAQLDELGSNVMDAYKGFAESLYLEPNVTPRLSIRDGNLQISIPLAPQDET